MGGLVGGWVGWLFGWLVAWWSVGRSVGFGEATSAGAAQGPGGLPGTCAGADGAVGCLLPAGRLVSGLACLHARSNPCSSLPTFLGDNITFWLRIANPK